MNVERLQQIEEIYHAALEMRGDARQSFFKKLCDADEDLRREIESLLAFEDIHDSFLDESPAVLAASFDKIELNRLTSNGLIAATAISPDGKYVVFARKDGDRQSLWLRQTDALGEVKVLPASRFDYQFLTFSKTEDALYFVAAEGGEKSLALYQTNRRPARKQF